MTNIITQKHSFDNDEKYEHKKEFSFWKTLIFGGQGCCLSLALVLTSLFVERNE